MAKRPRKNHEQLTFADAPNYSGQHGGRRPNAGRPKQAGSISHDTRPDLASRFPVHVTLRVIEGVAPISSEWLMKKIRPIIRRSHKADFSVIEFNVLTNHIHLIVEAAGKEALSLGIQALEVRLARNLNSAMNRSGQFFASRYNARALKTPREVRNALVYVLQNRKHHAAEQKFAKYWIDPCSSAAWFDGWAEPIQVTCDWKRELVEMAAPTRKATTWLLTTGWKRHGLLRFDERPR